MKIRPPKFTWPSYGLFVLIVCLPALLEWMGGNADLRGCGRLALNAATAYWGIYAVWRAVSMLTHLPPPGPRQ